MKPVRLDSSLHWVSTQHLSCTYKLSLPKNGWHINHTSFGGCPYGTRPFCSNIGCVGRMPGRYNWNVVNDPGHVRRDTLWIRRKNDISPLLALRANCILPLVSNVVDIAQQEEVTTEALLSVPPSPSHIYGNNVITRIRRCLCSLQYWVDR